MGEINDNKAAPSVDVPRFVRLVRWLTAWAWHNEIVKYETWDRAMEALREQRSIIDELHAQIDAEDAFADIVPAAIFARKTLRGGTLLYGAVKQNLLPDGVNDAVVVIRPQLLAIEDRTSEFRGHSWMTILQSGGKPNDLVVAPPPQDSASK